MKTIEARAYGYHASDQCCRDCENCEDRVNCFDADYVLAFIAGAKSEYEELTRWNSPDDPPKDRRLILIKVNVFDEGILYYVDRGFENADYILGPKDKILGWREIHE